MADKPKKPSNPRRVPVNSAAGISKALIAGGKKIEVPKHVDFSPLERLIFTELVEEMSKSELTAHKITMMVLLTRQMAMLQNEQVLLTEEGVVLTNSHGNAVANPRVKVCAGLTANVLSMRRSLGVHARELAGGDNRRTKVMRKHNKANEAGRENYDTNLINFPNAQETDDDD